MELKQAINIAIEYLGKEYFSKLLLSYKTSDKPEILSISKKENNVEIVYGSLASLFRGLTFVKESC